MVPRASMLLVLALVATGCRARDRETRAAQAAVAPDAAEPVDPPTPEGLQAYLGRELERIAAASDPMTAARTAVTRWQLPADAFPRLLSSSYAPHALEHGRGFAGHVDEIATQLVAAAQAHAPLAVRRHYAGDAANSPRQERLRWAVPPNAPGALAIAGELAIDVVFVHDGAAWRSLIGVDEMMLEAVAAGAADVAPGCERLVASAKSDRCLEIGWAIADAALRGQPDRLRRVCGLAKSFACTKNHR